jgi:hypothetical protein
MAVPITARIPTPPINFVFVFCFFKSDINFLFKLSVIDNWELLFNNIKLRLSIL